MKPTKASFQSLSAAPLAAIDYFRPMMRQTGCEITLEHWAALETFIAVGLRVMAKTNPSKIADEARTVEILTLMPKEKP